MELLFLSGSLRKGSYNTALMNAAMAMVPPEIRPVRAPAADALPFFNPDLDDPDEPLEPVRLWREALRRADGLMLFCPEYAHSLPGSLKNALDWVVGSGELVGKPVTIVTASTTHHGGEKVHETLAYLLRLLETRYMEGAALRVAAVNKKVDETGKITDPELEKALKNSVSALIRALSPPGI